MLRVQFPGFGELLLANIESIGLRCEGTRGKRREQRERHKGRKAVLGGVSPFSLPNRHCAIFRGSIQETPPIGGRPPRIPGETCAYRRGKAPVFVFR